MNWSQVLKKEEPTQPTAPPPPPPAPPSYQTKSEAQASSNKNDRFANPKSTDGNRGGRGRGNSNGNNNNTGTDTTTRGRGRGRGGSESNNNNHRGRGRGGGASRGGTTQSSTNNNSAVASSSSNTSTAIQRDEFPRHPYVFFSRSKYLQKALSMIETDEELSSEEKSAQKKKLQKQIENTSPLLEPIHASVKYHAFSLTGPTNQHGGSSGSGAGNKFINQLPSSSITEFSSYFAHLNLKLYFNQRIVVRKENGDLQIGIERALYGKKANATKDALLLDRKNTACLSLLIDKVVNEWSKPGVINSKELRGGGATNNNNDDHILDSSSYRLTREVTQVLESLVYLVYEDIETPTLNLAKSMKDVIFPSVAALTTFCAKISLLCLEPAMEKKPQRDVDQHQLQNVTSVFSPITRAQWKRTQNTEDETELKKRAKMQQTQHEVLLRTSATYLVACLVRLFPDAIFPLWTTLFPDGDPILIDPKKLPNREDVAKYNRMYNNNSIIENDIGAVAQTSSSLPYHQNPSAPTVNNRCPLLTPMLGDDIMVRVAATFTAVSLVAAIGNTLAVVPLEPATTTSTTTSSNLAASSSSSASHQQPKSDISRIGSVLLQVVQTIISALRIQDLNKEKCKNELAIVADKYMEKHYTVQKLIKKFGGNKKPLPRKHNEKKRDSDDDDDDDLDDGTETTLSEDPQERELNSQALQLSDLRKQVSRKAFEFHLSAIFHYDLINALGCLCVVIPLQRTPTVTRLIFSYLENFSSISINQALLRGVPISKRDGGQIHDHDVTGAVFLMQTLNHGGGGARNLVRTFEIKPATAGYKILDSALRCLPHIDVWKLCSAIGRNQPDVFRLFLWKYIFPEAAKLFKPLGRNTNTTNISTSNAQDDQQQQQHQQDAIDEELDTAISGRSNVMRKGSMHGRRSVPYQSSIEALRCLVYFIGARPFPWEVTFAGITSSGNKNANNNNNSNQRHYSLKINLPPSKSLRNASTVNNNSLAKYQQQQSNQIAFLTGGTLIATIPRSSVNAKNTTMQSRNKTVGGGMATNIIPDDKLLVADDQLTDEVLLTFTSSSMNKHKRASTAETAKIVQEIALPASRSGVENIRCVAYRLLATVPNEFFAICCSDEKSQERKDLEDSLRQEMDEGDSSSNDNNNKTNSAETTPFKLFSKQDVEQNIIKMIIEKCRGEVDEPRLEAITACFNFVASCPALAKIADFKISTVICDDLIGRNLLSNGETKTRCCQVLEALSDRISFYCIDKNTDSTAAECSRLLRASSSILTHNEKQLATSAKQQNYNESNTATCSSNNTSPTISIRSSVTLSLTQFQREEITTQNAACLRCIASSVCTLPEDYLFMEFGSRGDDVVSWAFELMLDSFNKHADKSWYDEREMKSSNNDNNNNNSSSDNNNSHHKRHDSCTSITSSSAGSASSLVDISISEEECIMLIASLDGLCRLSSKKDVAECDASSVFKTVNALYQTVNLFSTITDLTNEVYFLCGGALRLGVRLLVSLVKNKTAREYFSSSVIVADFIRLVLRVLYRVSNDADIGRAGGLRTEFNESCVACLFSLVDVLNENEKKTVKLFVEEELLGENNHNKGNDDDREYFDLMREEHEITIEFLKRSFPQVHTLLKKMLEIDRRASMKDDDDDNNSPSAQQSSPPPSPAAVGKNWTDDEKAVDAEFQKERGKSKFLANWS